MDWFDIVKRRRGKPKDRPPDIMGGEKMPEEKRKLLRKGVENKKIYYSHKKVKLNLKN